MRYLFGLLIWLSASHAAFAEYDGVTLYAQCQHNRDFVEGYVSGFLDKAIDDSIIVSKAGFVGKFVTKEYVAAAKYHNLGIRQTIEGYCKPASVSAADAADLFCKYLGAHPEIRKYKGAYIANIGFHESWCAR